MGHYGTLFSLTMCPILSECSALSIVYYIGGFIVSQILTVERLADLVFSLCRCIFSNIDNGFIEISYWIKSRAFCFPCKPMLKEARFVLLYRYMASYICSCHEDVLNVPYKFVYDNARSGSRISS